MNVHKQLSVTNNLILMAMLAALYVLLIHTTSNVYWQGWFSACIMWNSIFYVSRILEVLSDPT